MSKSMKAEISLAGSVDPSLIRAVDTVQKKLGTLGKIEKVAKTAAKGFAITGAAVAAAAVPIAALTKQSLDAYAQYEQLVGGVDTLFKGSSQTVQRYAEDAYKTAGIDANNYMETVTSFSASLINSLGGDTSKAAEMANMAVTDMSDNANKMGTDMEMIQRTYQSLARGNWGMLDNLKLGYGGTKAEGERLIQTANEIRKANGLAGDLSKDKFSDVVEAIHLVQEQMEITGTTAEEAEHTIEGSVKSAKAAYKNWVTGLANEDADLGKLTDQLMDSVATAASNIIPRVQVILSRLGAFIRDYMPQIASGIASVLPGLVSTLLPAAIDLLGAIAQGLIAAVPGVLAGVGEAVVEVVSQTGSRFAQALGFDVSPDEIAGGMREAFASAVDAAIEFASQVAAPLASVGQAFVDLARNAAEPLGQLWGVLSSLGSAVAPLLAPIVNGIATAVSGIVNAFSGIFSLVMAVIEPVVSVLSGPLMAVCQVVGAAFEILGASIGTVLNGIGAAAQWLADTLNAVFGWIADALSPVIEFFSGIGSALGDFLGSFGDFFGVFTGQVGEATGETAELAAQMGQVDSAAQSAASGTEDMGQRVQAAADQMNAAFEGMSDSEVPAPSTDQLVSNLDEAGQAAQDMAGQVNEAYGSIESPSITMDTSALSGVTIDFSGLTGAAQSAKSEVVSVFSSLGSEIASAVAGGMAAAGNSFTTIVTSAQSTVSSVTAAFQGIGTNIGSTIQAALSGATSAYASFTSAATSSASQVMAAQTAAAMQTMSAWTAALAAVAARALSTVAAFLQMAAAGTSAAYSVQASMSGVAGTISGIASAAYAASSALYAMASAARSASSAAAAATTASRTAQLARFATGGVTNGPSLAGEDPRYPHEFVISPNPAYRAMNERIVAMAAHRLGMATDAPSWTKAGSSIRETDAYSVSNYDMGVTVDVGGVTFSPVVNVNGNADKEDIIAALREVQPEFYDLVRQAVAAGEETSYGFSV